MIKFVQQNEVEDITSMIDMIMPIHVEDDKVVL